MHTQEGNHRSTDLKAILEFPAARVAMVGQWSVFLLDTLLEWFQRYQGTWFPLTQTPNHSQQTVYIYKVIFKCLSLEDSSAASATSSEFRQAEAEKKALEELMGKVPVTDFGEPTSLGSMNPGCGNSVIFNGYWTGPTFLCRSYNWIIWLWS